MIAHYPSSAELAAFRRSIDAMDRAFQHRWPVECAWPDELAHGIGYNTRTRKYGPSDWWTEPFWGGIARSMAAAQRRAAYERGI